MAQFRNMPDHHEGMNSGLVSIQFKSVWWFSLYVLIKIVGDPFTVSAIGKLRCNATYS
jgi:hypothetical protein